jgi:hypothetical protein
MTQAAVEKLPINVHTGNALRYMGDQYATGAHVLRELAQNGIDKAARNIWIKVDCQARSLQSYDDGNGAGLNELTRKFANIADSDKDAAKGDLGNKGIGNLAGPAVAEEWQLVTRDTLTPGDKLRSYSFRRDEMTKKDGLGVYVETLPSNRINGDAPFPATTVVKLREVDEIILKQIGDKDAMEKIIRESFSHAIRVRKINVIINYRDFKGRTTEFRIKPTTYRGTALDKFELETEYGFVSFNFFFSPHPVEKPTVVVQHQGAHALPISNFFHLRILPKEIEALFSRGYFEGEIQVGFCDQNADHTAFRPNHECQMFAAAVTNFAEDVLSPIIRQFEDEDRNDRLRRVTERAVRRMKSFLTRQQSNLPPMLKAAVVRYVKSDEATACVPGGLRLIPGKPPTTFVGGGSSTVGTTTEPVEKPSGTKKAESATPVPPRPPRVLPPNAFKKQKEETQKVRAAKATGTVTPAVKKPKVELVDGLSIQLVDPDPSDSLNWRSRTTPEGVIQVNVVSTEFREAERRGSSELERFELMLLQKELTCAGVSPREAQDFDRIFEGTFLTLWRASLQG